MRIFHLVEAESLWALSQRGAVNLPQVKDLQDKLRAAGFDPGASDGWYGKKTADAVRAYQEANGLTVDGDAGPQTLGKLGMGGANNTPPRETPPEETPPAPAPRQPASEPPDEPAPTTRREPEQTTTREPERGAPETPTYNPDTPWRVTPDAVPGDGYEPTRPEEPEIPFYDVGDGTNRRKIRNAINNMGLKTDDKFGYDNMLGSGDGALLFVQYINAYTFNDRTVRNARKIIDLLQRHLRGDAYLKVAVRTRGGTALANGELFLDPMPTENESIDRLSNLAGIK